MSSTSASSVANRTSGALNAGSMRASTTGTNNSSGAAKSAAAVSSPRPTCAATSGAKLKKMVNAAQKTSGGSHAPGANENASHDAITVKVVTAAAACSNGCLRIAATAKSPASSNRRKPNSSQARSPKAGTALMYTAKKSGSTADIKAVYSNVFSGIPDGAFMTRRCATTAPAIVMSGNRTKMLIASVSELASRNVNTQPH